MEPLLESVCILGRDPDRHVEPQGRRDLLQRLSPGPAAAGRRRRHVPRLQLQLLMKYCLSVQMLP